MPAATQTHVVPPFLSLADYKVFRLPYIAFAGINEFVV